MKTLLILLGIILTMFLIGCDKKDNPAAPSTETSVRFTTTTSVKVAPVYFDFATGTTTDSAGTWDVKLTYTLMMVDTSMPAIKYPFIALNQTRSVMAKIVDGTEFSSCNGTAMSGLAADAGSNAVIGMNCLNYDGGTHLLNPFPNRTFVVQTGAGVRVKFKMVSYYNEALASGYMTIDYVKY